MPIPILAPAPAIFFFTMTNLETQKKLLFFIHRHRVTQ
jgi:hypothetical protein